MKEASKQQQQQVRRDIMTLDQLEWLKGYDPDSYVLSTPEGEAIVSGSLSTDRGENIFNNLYAFLEWRAEIDGIDDVIDMLGYSSFGELVENIAGMSEDSTLDDIVEAYAGVSIEDYCESLEG